MLAAGKTHKVTAEGVRYARKTLCLEKNAKTAPSSACAKKVVQLVKKTSKGLCYTQLEQWQRIFLMPAVGLAGAAAYRKVMKQAPDIKNPASASVAALNNKRERLYKAVALQVLRGGLKLTDVSGKQYTFEQYLNKGAAFIKKYSRAGGFLEMVQFYFETQVPW